MILLHHLRVQALKHLRDIDIWFPRHGSVLIEGQNEAGKSTLFEAIYFALYGAPLVGEEARATLEDLLPHDGTAAQVELTLTTQDALLEIRRRLVPATSSKRTIHEARVRVRRNGAPVEELNSPQAVNTRILQELNGLDGDALRNSCFMEQKALDRVERLSRGQRDSAVARLVGVERLRQIEKDLRAANDDQQRQLTRLREEYEIASLRQAATVAEQQAEEAAELVHAAQVYLLLEERKNRTADNSVLGEQIAALETQRATLGVRMRATTQRQTLLSELRGARELFDQAIQAEQARVGTLRTLEELTQIEQVVLPTVEARVRALHTLESELIAGEATHRAWQRAEDERLALEHFVYMQNVLQDAEEEYTLASEAAARAIQRGMLTHWIQLKELATLVGSDGTEAVALAEQSTQMIDEIIRRAAKIRRAQIWVVLVALVALLAVEAGFEFAPAWVVAGLLLSGAVFFQWRIQQQREGLRTFKEQRTQVSIRLVGLTAQIDTARHMMGDTFGGLPQIEQQLRTAGLTIATLEDGRTLLATLGEDASDADADVLQQLRDAAKQTVAEQRARVTTSQEQLQRLFAGGEMPQGASSLQAIQQHSAELSILVRQHEAAIIAQSAALAVAPEVRVVVAAYTVAEAERDNLRQQLVGVPALVRQLQECDEKARHSARGAAEGLANFQEQWRLAGLVEPESVAVLLDINEPDLTAIYAEYAQFLAAQLHEGAEAKVAAELATVEERLRLLIQQHNDGGSAVSPDEQIAELLGNYGIAYSNVDTFESLTTRWPALAHAQGEQRDAYEEYYQYASREAHHLRQSAAEHAASYGLADAVLHAEGCAARLEAGERICRQYALAVEIAQQVRARIVRRILPETEAHMRALLPELTAGRYHDVQLLAEDPNNQSADLSIKLWDEVAGRHVAKNLFSGGTRDQSSLALRLAFALATLPKELGAMPGFIFLDEPLSSFDEERTQALVHILTQGIIARQFDQVVLISHRQSFDTSSFGYYLRVEHGRIVESNLPTADEVSPPAVMSSSAALLARQQV